MKTTRLSLIALGAILPLSAAKADLSSSLIAYYDFEATSTDGIANQVGGAATHNGSYGSGTTFGVTPANGTGAGFAGSASFEGAESTSTTDRSLMLVGKALNLAKNDASSTAGSGWFNVPTLNSAALGANFTISAWFFLAPDADNTGTTADILRDYIFEGGTNFDVSFGTGAADGTTYNSWLGETVSSTSPSLSNGEWHHVVHVFSQNGANTELKIFIDGVKVGATLSTASTNMNLASLNIGAARNGVRVFDGMIDEVAVWTRALKPSEVTELHARGTVALALDDPLPAGKAFVGVDASDPLMGQVSGSGLYDVNEKIQIDVVPALGHVFNGWSSPFGGEDAAFELTVTGSVSFTANLSQDTADDDIDGLNNYQELVVYQTVPDDADTDDDLIEDGDEVLLSHTNPLTSQLDAVNYILENFSGGAGPGDTVIARNTTNNTLTLKLKPAASTTLGQGSWSSLTPASPGVTGAASAGDFLLQVPATADLKRFFRIEGGTP